MTDFELLSIILQTGLLIVAILSYVKKSYPSDQDK